METTEEKLIEEKYRRQIRLKLKFKATVRHLIYNMPWLIAEKEFDINDVKRNFALLGRGKNMKDDLTLADKILFRKHPDLRTDDEMRHMCKVIGEIKSLRRFSEEIKYQLVKYLYFEYYDSGRTLIRQGHQGTAMYFLISGEIAYSKKEWNADTKEWNIIPLEMKTTGQMFGDMALLHNYPRKATVVAITPLEVLTLTKEHFNMVLLNPLKKEWNEIHDALSLFSYFNGWNENLLQECCLLSKIKFYEENEIIYGDNALFLTDMVYFIIEGKCSIIDHLKVIEKTQNQTKTFDLYDPEIHDAIYKRHVKSRLPSEHQCLEEEETPSEVNVNMLFKSLNNPPTTSKGSLDFEKRNSLPLKISEVDEWSFDKIKHSNIRKKNKGKGDYTEIKNYFMQICVLTRLGTFKNGPYLNNRRVIALTRVKCLLLPAHFLEQNNKAYIWERIDSYLMEHIPTREEVFQQFLKYKKWFKFCEKHRNELLAKRSIPAEVSIQTVPYSCRINNIRY